ncbi:MAG: hypothetical protein CMH31_01720 [Micavibrio sp.]|nr:hypothetical protein [Micavibrio sp.]|tara:strand:+ start:1361 stop:1603 length:243 start_codon:yes stop_codon:yes gene_type:complete
MSDIAELTETFTGHTHELPSGQVVSIWENSNTGLPPYKDWLTLHYQATALEKQGLKATPYREAMEKIKTAEARAKQPKFI